VSADPIRVLHVFGRLDRGGAELRTLEIAESFAGERVRTDFLVLSGLDGSLDDRVERAGGRVIKCRLGARFPLAFFRLLRAERYDAVESHVHFFSGIVLLIARAAGVRSRIAVLHTAVVNDGGTGWRRRAQLALCHALLDWHATDIVGVGVGAMDGAWGRQWRTDPRCRVIHAGVAPDRLRQVPAAARDAATIVNVASLQPLKNQQRLIRVLARIVPHIPAVRLRLIGREIGDYGQALRQAAIDAGVTDRVEFVGEVDDPMPLVAGASLMMLPSLWEGLPGAALEACALGIPVLASDLPGTRELARHFADLRVLSLDEDDETWAATAMQLMQADLGARVAPLDRLAGTPFTLERTREAYYELWSRRHASA
jgi:glycosyltransferase involved in cell wall biosynthesis